MCVQVDSADHVQFIDQVWGARCRETASAKEGWPLPKCRVCVDVDVSYRPLPGVHLGAQRSPCRSLADFEGVVEAIQESRHCSLAGVMGYEAQVVGVPDANPFSLAMNPAVTVLKVRPCPVCRVPRSTCRAHKPLCAVMCARGCLRQKYSWKDVQRKRLAVADLLRQQSIKLEFFNGGGSGGLATSCSDPSLTEVGGCCAVLRGKCCVRLRCGRLLRWRLGRGSCNPRCSTSLPRTSRSQPSVMHFRRLDVANLGSSLASLVDSLRLARYVVAVAAW